MISTVFSTTGLKSETFSISHTDYISAYNITYTVEASKTENNVPLYIFSICKADKEIFRALYSQSRLDDVISLLTKAKGENTNAESPKPPFLKSFLCVLRLFIKEMDQMPLKIMKKLAGES